MSPMAQAAREPEPTSPPRGSSRAGEPARRRSRRSWWFLLATVLVISGAVLAGLDLTGELPWQHASGGATPAFSSARSAAEAAARTHGATNLTLSWAVGYLSQADLSVPLNFTHYPSRGPECAFVPAVAGARTLSAVPNVTTGETHDWTFVFANGTGSFLLVDVVGGAAEYAGSFDGFGCPFSAPGSAPVPLGVVDPSTASRVALAAGGLAFLTDHPDANGTLTLIGPSAGSPSEWRVELSSCPAAVALPITGVSFVASVNSTSGGFLGAQNLTVECPWVDQVQTVPLGQALAVTSAFGTSAGATYWYNSTVRSLSFPFPIQTLTPALQRANGSSLSVPGAQLTVLDASGTLRAQFDLTAGAWSSGGSVILAIGDRFILTSPTSLSGQGDYLTLVGSGYFPGTVGIPIS